MPGRPPTYNLRCRPAGAGQGAHKGRPYARTTWLGVGPARHSRKNLTARSASF